MPLNSTGQSQLHLSVRPLTSSSQLLMRSPTGFLHPGIRWHLAYCESSTGQGVTK
jgi:hypothetical protein